MRAAADAGLPVATFVAEAALRAAGRQSAPSREEMRGVLVAVRQAANALEQIGAQASRTLKVGVFNALEAKRRLRDIEKALAPLFTRHGG